MRRTALLALALAASFPAACTAPPPPADVLTSAQVLRAPRPWPTARVAASALEPQILAVHLNETTIANGDRWSGRIATTTNVASLEVRTESFSFVATRVAYGQFRFNVHVLDLPPQYKRGYSLQIIARNAAGDEAQRFVPIRFV